MWKIFRATAMGLGITILFQLLTGMVQFSQECSQIRDNVLRLHVLANSDSEEDQLLKLKVRDRILKQSSALFYHADSKQQAKMISQQHLDQLQQVAQQEVLDNGYDYAVSVKVVEMFFENRVYDQITMPAGRYDALRITIGDAQGQNWWCVIYPALCLPAFEQPTPQQMEQFFGEKGNDILEHPQEYQVEFALIEMFEKIKQRWNPS